MHPIVLNIPARFLYGLSAVAPRRAWGVNLLTYYPSFTSPSDPENAPYGLACVGICDGQILISIGNRTHGITPDAPSAADFIAHAQLKWLRDPAHAPPNAQIRDLIPTSPFDEAFERTLTSLHGPPTKQIDRVYMRRSKTRGYYDLVATCNTNPSRTTCILHFSLTCSPATYVTVNGLDGSYLARAADIQEKTDRFLSAMIRTPACSN
jgi:hypothetical protein